VIRPVGAFLGAWPVLGAPALWACEPSAGSGAEARPMCRVDPGARLVRFDGEAGRHTFTGRAGRMKGWVRVDDAARPREGDACLQIAAVRP
jgi:hypothetical protein